LELVQQWPIVAKQMSQPEAERSRLNPTPTPSAEINNARLAWVRIMNALQANAELAGIDEATDHLSPRPPRVLVLDEKSVEPKQTHGVADWAAVIAVEPMVRFVSAFRSSKTRSRVRPRVLES
jgi:hypothetical protein